MTQVKKTRILVADDREVNRELLRACLEPIGYEITTCASASEALRRAHANTPDLMISDIHMDPTSGVLLCRCFKDDPQLQRVPFMLFSASYPTEKEMQDARESGAECCMNRPLDPQDLIALVGTCLRRNAEARCCDRQKGPALAPAQPGRILAATDLLPK